MPAIIDRLVAKDQDSHDTETLRQTFLNPLGSRTYSKQYAQLYDYRLAYLKPRILQRSHHKWFQNFESFSQTQSQSQEQEQEEQPMEQDQHQHQHQHQDRDKVGASREKTRRLVMSEPPKHVDRILDVQHGEVCYVVGNLYCYMPLKPDVLEDLTREQWLAPQPVRSKYIDYDRDELFIEDQSGRVKLVGDAIKGGTSLRAMFVTGAVGAVLGTETRDGNFEVVDAIFASLPQPSPVQGEATKQTKTKTDKKTQDDATTDSDKDGWVVLMSGMAIGGDENVETQFNMQLLVEWLTGELGEKDDRTDSSKIVAAIIAGNALAPPCRNDDEVKAKRYGQDVPTFSPAPTLALDQFLTDLCGSMPVHIMPGERDPASIAIPQQPIHFALLPRAGRFDSLYRETNPVWIGIRDRKLLGTSGQNIDDIFKYVDEDDDSRIEMAMRLLEWGHIAPTAPDTLWCFPFKTNDPFTIKQRPDVLFIGNQPKFASAFYYYDDDDQFISDEIQNQTEAYPTRSGCRVVLVPEFCKTNQVVLVNMSTLDTKLVEIGTGL